MSISLDKNYSGHRIGLLKSDVNTIPVYHSVAWQQSDRRQYYFAVGQSSGKTVLAE